MKDSDFVFQHRHAQTTENTLQDDGANCGDAQRTDPTTRVYEPKPRCKNNCKKPNGGSDQTMSVLKKNPPAQFRGGKWNNVRAKRGGPTRNGEPTAFARRH